MKKKVFAVFMAILMSFAFIGLRVNAEGEEEVTTTGTEGREPMHVIVFHGETCPHCQEAFEWFDSIEEEYGQYFDLEKYEVWNDESNASLMEQVANYFGEEAEGVPYIIIGTKTFSGFADSYKQQIIDAIMDEYNKNDEERTNAVYNVLNNVERVEEKDSATVVIFILIVLAIVAFIIFARNGQDTAEMKFENKKQNVIEDDDDDYDDEDDDDNDEDEDEEEVVVRTSKKVKHSSKSSTQRTSNNSSNRTSSNSSKKSNKKKSKK